MDSFNLDLHESELSTVFMFIDIDGSDNVDYPEFVRKLSRAGVKIRNEDEKIVYNLYQKIQQIGYSIKDIFMSFDKNFDNNITKDELGAGFEKVGIQIDQKIWTKFSTMPIFPEMGPLIMMSSVPYLKIFWLIS